MLWSHNFPPHSFVSSVSKSTFIACRLVISICYNLFPIFCVITYVMILLTILKSRRAIQMDNNNDVNSTNRLQYIINYIRTQGYTTPFFITLSYIMFVNIPSILRMICVLNGCSTSDLIMRLWGISFPFNNLSDVLIYIFFDKDVWMYLKRKFTKTNVVANVVANVLATKAIDNKLNVQTGYTSV